MRCWIKFFLLCIWSLSVQADEINPCGEDPARLKARSAELRKLAEEDQADRKTPHIDWAKIFPRDVQRRKRVGEIFGEGCFHQASDFASAATVFQHGDIPEHFLMTFLWSKKAFELSGDPQHKWWTAAGIDRYLVKSGLKQLFATQASRPEGESCYCLEQVEESFPQSKRTEYVKKDIAAALRWVNELNSGTHCSPAQFCSKSLKAAPSGTVPGFW